MTVAQPSTASSARPTLSLPAHAAASAAAAPLPSERLLRGRKTVEINHNGEIYRLQNTRQGKLILTK